MKILFLIEELVRGGIERRLTELLKGLSKFPEEYEIHLTLAKQALDYKDIEQLDINLHFLKPVSNLQLIQTYRKHFKKIQPDIIHSWSLKTSFYTAFLKPYFKYKFVSGFIGDTFGFAKNYGFLTRYFIYPKSDYIISNSKKGLIAYHVPEDKGLVVYNGFAPSRISNSKINKLKELGITTPLIVVMLANVHPYKDYMTFINLAKRVTGIRNDVTFISIGKIFPEFEDLTNDFINNKNPYIKFLGYREDVSTLIKDCHLGILCTYSEGISNAIIELMANEIPVITTDINGGSSELIQNQVDGVICGNDKIVPETIRLLENTLERLKMGKRAKLKIEGQFSLNAMVESYRKLYNTL